MLLNAAFRSCKIAILILILIFNLMNTMSNGKILLVSYQDKDILKPIKIKLSSGLFPSNSIMVKDIYSYLRKENIADNENDDTVIEIMDNASKNYVTYHNNNNDHNRIVHFHQGVLHILIKPNSNSSSGVVFNIEGKLFNHQSTSAFVLLDSHNREHQVHISEDNDPEKGTGLVIWDSAVILAKYFEKNQHIISDKHVIEVGSGTGFLGISCYLLGTSKVLMTDLPYTISNIIRNIQRNGNHDGMLYKVLDWFDDATYLSLDDKNEYDIIVGADIVWLDYLVEPLVNTLKSLCHSKTIVYLSYQLRSVAVDDLLWMHMNKYFIIQKVSSASLHPSYQSDKISIYECKPIIIKSV